MPIRGESVGTAYIKVYADGSSIPGDIERQFDDVDTIADRHGTSFAKKWEEAVNDELSKHDANSLDQTFARAIASDKVINDFFSGSDWNRIKTRFNTEFGKLGDEEVASMEKAFREKGSLSGIDTAIDKSVHNIRRHFDELRIAEEKESARIRKLGEDFRAFWFQVEDDSDKAGNAFTRFFSRMRSGKRDVDRTTTIFGKLSRTVDGLADGIGRAFGKGSRNDFLNFTGSFVANASKLISLPFKILDNIGQFGKAFKEAQDLGQGFFSSIKAGFAGMAKDAEGGGTALSEAFSSLLISVPALVVALVAMVSVLSIVAALISGIVAAIIAMASTLSFAIVGAFIPFLGLLGPIAAGIGVVVLALKGMDGKTKESLQKAIKPLISGFHELGDAARKGIGQGLGNSFDRLIHSMSGLKPLVHDIGQAIGDITRRFINLGNKPGPRRFFDRLESDGPRIIHDLGRIVLNVTRALSNLFAEATDDAVGFLEWLIKITREFRQWTYRNPQAIHKFFEDAKQSAKVFGDFIAALGRVLGDLLFSQSGKKAGDNIFKGMTDALNQFDEFLDKHPHGLADFFKNGQQTAEDIGNLAVSLVDIFDALDSPEGRKNLHEVMDALIQISKLAGPLAAISNFSIDSSGFNTIATLAGPIDSFTRSIARIGNIRIPAPNWHALVDWIPGVAKTIGNFFHNLFGSQGGGRVLAIQPPAIHWDSALNKIAAFFQNVIRLGTAPQRALISAMQTAADGVVHALNGIPARLGHLGGPAGAFAVAAAGWALGILHEIGTVPGSIVSFFHGLGGRIADAIGSIGLHFDFPNPPSWLAKAAGPGGVLLDRLTATGGIFDGAQVRVIGEAGREAVVPLTGPLSQVDPSVRELSRIARGLSSADSATVQAVPGKNITVEQHITTPATDPVAAASEFLNHLTAVVA